MPGPIKGDYNVPLRHRQRSAISCVECRRRKIKCDRAEPCGHCRQSRGITCVYSKYTRPASRGSQRSAVSISSTSSLSTGSPGFKTLNIHGGSNVSANTPCQNGHDTGCLEKLGTQSAVTGIENTQKTASSEPQCCNSQSTAAVRRRENRFIAPREKGAVYEQHRRSNSVGFTFATCGDLVVNDGGGKGKLTTKISPQGDLQMYFYGQSHWKHNLRLISKLASMGGDIDDMAAELRLVNIEMWRLTEKYKTTARETKSSLSSLWPSNPSLHDYFPARNMADQLVQNYLRTMESTHRIVHIPSFNREYEAYWRDPQRTSESSALKILLIMAIGTCFYQEADSASLRTAAKQWVHRAQVWVSGPLDKNRLNLSGLQIQCLLLLARHTNDVGPDLTWIATGTLLHSSCQLGLHRDPQYFPQMSILHSELRRRLWATVLDLAIQTALETGMVPILALDECNTRPPANINDDAISSTTATAPTPLPAGVYTDTSLQIHLLASLPTRYNITRHLNILSSDPVPPYDELIRLGAELSATCNMTAVALKTYPPSLAHPTPFHARHLDLSTRRFLFAAHRPFALNSNATADNSSEEWRHVFSREVCLETAMVLTKPEPEGKTQTVPSTVRTCDYTRLLHTGGGFYRTITLSAFAIMCHFLIQQYRLAPSPSSSSSGPRILLHARLLQLTDLSFRRFVLGTTSVKWYLLLSIALGHADALERAEDGRRGMLEGAKRGKKACAEVLGMQDVGRMGGEQVLGEVMDLTAKSEGQLGWDTACEDLGEDDSMMQGHDAWATFDFDGGALNEWFVSGWEENVEW